MDGKKCTFVDISSQLIIIRIGTVCVTWHSPEVQAQTHTLFIDMNIHVRMIVSPTFIMQRLLIRRDIPSLPSYDFTIR